jgi:hypothetical protein
MMMTQWRLVLLSKISGKPASLKIDDAFPGQENDGTQVELLLPASRS